MAYKNFALYFQWIDQIVNEIITNIFTQLFISASLAHLCPSNSLWSNYQTHRLQKIQITNFFPINFKNMFAKKELSVYIERKEYSI